MSCEKTNSDRKELLVTLSVAALISDVDSTRLLLVKHRKDGSWGLPAGGLKWLESEGRIETVYEALKRELREETGLEPKQLHYNIIGLINLPREGKNSFGAIFDVDFEDTREHLTDGGESFLYKPTDTEEIESVEYFKPVQLLTLMRKGIIYKPDFNRGLIHWWIQNSERLTWDPYRGATPEDEDFDLDEELLRRLDRMRISDARG